MAKALNVPETEHTHGDLMLTVKAQELELPSTTNWMLEMGRIEQLFKLSTKQVKGLLEKFASMKPTSSGEVSLDRFLEVLDLPRCYFSEQIFHLLDPSGTGFMTFQEFVAVSGSIINHEDHEHHVKLAFDACHLDKDGHILYTQVSKTPLLFLYNFLHEFLSKYRSHFQGFFTSCNSCLV
jgi:lysophosphatidylcholine acyltransferase/lyso-PAF acetyltransferase